jgi:uncharacterized protein YijF (DUF1287 family)
MTDLNLRVGDKVTWTINNKKMIGVVLDNTLVDMVEIMIHSRGGTPHFQPTTVAIKKLSLFY